MGIFAISDLHLSFGNNKPMDIFGEGWENHYMKIEEDWKSKVTSKDIVILAGDFSWATYLKDTYQDFEYLNKLPGKKLLLKGNHDYWWTTVTKMNNFLKENDFNNIEFIYNNSIEYNGYSICGTRGWSATVDSEYNDEKILEREYQRLEYSLKQAKTENIIVVLHFPPNEKFMKIMKKYNVEICIYGHLHGKMKEDDFLPNKDGIKYYLTSADKINFKLVEIL